MAIDGTAHESREALAEIAENLGTNTDNRANYVAASALRK